jgi:hypothetical protein
MQISKWQRFICNYCMCTIPAPAYRQGVLWLVYREIWGLQLCTEDLQSIKLWPKVYWQGGGWIKAPKYLQLRHH